MNADHGAQAEGPHDSKGPNGRPESAADVRIDSRASFTAAVMQGFAAAMAGSSRRIVCVDADFADWPLDDPALHQQWMAWLRRPQRQLVLLAADFARVPQRHPRFVTWRREWSHAISPLAAPPDVAANLPTLLLDDQGLMLRLVDRVHWRGRLSRDEASARPWREEIDALLQRSEAAFPVNTLGL